MNNYKGQDDTVKLDSDDYDLDNEWITRNILTIDMRSDRFKLLVNGFIKCIPHDMIARDIDAGTYIIVRETFEEKHTGTSYITIVHYVDSYSLKEYGLSNLNLKPDGDLSIKVDDIEYQYLKFNAIDGYCGIYFNDNNELSLVENDTHVGNYIMS